MHLVRYPHLITTPTSTIASVEELDVLRGGSSHIRRGLRGWSSCGGRLGSGAWVLVGIALPSLLGGIAPVRSVPASASHFSAASSRPPSPPSSSARAGHVVQVAPLSVNAVGAASLFVQLPWKPTVTEPPGAMAPL